MLIPIRVNPGNGLTVATIHYSLDPEKDDAWAAVAKKKMNNEARWSREMEIDWTAAGGTLVYPYFSEYQSKLVIPPFEIPKDKGWFTAGLDHGALNPTAYLLFWVDPMGSVYLVYEYYCKGHYMQHVEEIKSSPHFSKVNGAIWCDPSMSAQNEQHIGGLKSMIDLYREEGVHMQAAPRVDRVTRAQRIGALWYGGNLSAANPRFMIFDTCVNTIREFKGLRHDQYTGIAQGKHNQAEGVMKKDDHSWDAASGMFTANNFFEINDTKEDPNSMAVYMRESLDDRKSDGQKMFFYGR